MRIILALVFLLWTVPAFAQLGPTGVGVSGASVISSCGASNNQLLYDNSGACAGLSTVNSGVLITSGAGVPSISTALPNVTINGSTAPASKTLAATDLSNVTLTGSCSNSNAALTCDPINLGLSATASGNVLTIALKGGNGSDPSATNPVYIPFRSTTLATGTPVYATATSALSIATPSSAATLGSSNAVAFRFWIVALYNGTTLDLGIINCSTYTTTAAQIYTLNEGALQTSVALNSSSTSAGVIYSGSARSSFAIRIIGYLDYSAGLTTAGTYASSPTTVQIAGPGLKKPGDVIQRVLTSSTSNTTVTASTSLTTTNVTANITPTTTINLIRAVANGTTVVVGTATADITTNVQIYRGTTAIGVPLKVGTVDSTALAATDNMPTSLEWLDGPASTSAQTYAVKIQNSGSTASTSGSFPNTTGGTMILEEIQG